MSYHLGSPANMTDKQGRDRVAVRISEDTAELHRNEVEAIKSNFFVTDVMSSSVSSGA